MTQNYPTIEYHHLSYMFQNLITTIRISFGDFKFDAPTLLDSYDNRVYWFVWFTIVVTTCIIFLNFIIPEVSSSYGKVKVNIKGLVLRERASLVNEIEGMFTK